MSSGDLDGIPRLRLRPPASEQSRILRSIQRIVLQHPVAAQAAFASLVQEGRQFARTPKGAEWQRRLEKSALLRRARTGFDAATLWMLEETSASEVPSAFIDTLMTAAKGRGLEPVIDDLLRGPLGRRSHGRS